MKTTFKKAALRIVFFCNICFAVVLLAAAASPHLNPYQWWPLALSGILFPLLLLIVFLFFIFWLPVNYRKATVSLVAILASIPNILTTFGTTFSSNFTQTKVKTDLRVLTWNTGLMNYTAPDDSTAIKNNAIIFRKLKETDADVICLQEFFTAVIPGHYLNFIDSIAKTMNYPYHYFSFDVPKFNGSFYMGTIIFSRYAMTDTQKIDYPKPFAGSVLKAGVVIGKDTIDIVTTRLQTVNFQRNEYAQLHNIKNGTDSEFSGTRNIIAKLRMGYKRRVEQVQLVKELISKSNRALIFTGDLNDVPVSYTYSEIRNTLSDAWIKKGYGLGRTFIYLSPTLRIDQVFFNNYFMVRQVKRIFPEGASDHNAIMVDLTLKRKQ